MAKKLNNEGIFWDVEVPVSEVLISEKKKILVKRVAKANKDYVDVRQNYLDKDGEWKYGKGIVIPLEHAEDVAELIKGAVNEDLFPF